MKIAEKVTKIENIFQKMVERKPIISEEISEEEIVDCLVENELEIDDAEKVRMIFSVVKYLLNLGTLNITSEIESQSCLRKLAIDLEKAGFSNNGSREKIYSLTGIDLQDLEKPNVINVTPEEEITESIFKETVVGVPVGVVRCKNCNHLIENNLMIICPKCRKGVYGEDTCPHCNKKIYAKSPYCPKCGKPIDFQQSSFPKLNQNAIKTP